MVAAVQAAVGSDQRRSVGPHPGGLRARMRRAARKRREGSLSRHVTEAAATLDRPGEPVHIDVRKPARLWLSVTCGRPLGDPRKLPDRLSPLTSRVAEDGVCQR